MTTLHLPDIDAARDLLRLVRRAARLSDDAAVRLQAVGDVLAVTVAALDRPTVLGLRTVGLARPAECDAVVAVAAVRDRMERGSVDLVLPPVEVHAAWAGISPPRTGWSQEVAVEAGLLREAAARGVDEVAQGVGVPGIPGIPGQAKESRAGSAAVADLRRRIWSRPLLGDTLPSLPMGAAFAADSLGFLGDDDEPVPVYSSGPWTRLGLTRGHVLARREVLGG